MYYAKWIDGLLDVVEEPKDGYKLMIFTEPPEAPSGYCASFYWYEIDNAWKQTWEIIQVNDEVSDSEVLNILLGGDENA